ncbi:MAG: hypothetical protein QXZ06_08635 [Candidatus Jordarchaeales archaeon]
MAESTRINIEWETEGYRDVVTVFNKIKEQKDSLLKNFEKLAEQVDKTWKKFVEMGGAVQSLQGPITMITADQVTLNQELGKYEAASMTVRNATEINAKVLNTFHETVKATTGSVGKSRGSLLQYAITFWVVGATVNRVGRAMQSFIDDVSKVGEAAARARVQVEAFVPEAKIQETITAFRRLGATGFVTDVQIAQVALAENRLSSLGATVMQLRPLMISLALATGKDLAGAYEMLVDYVNRGSTALFNSIGIAMSKAEEEAILQQMLGKTSDQLSRQELQAARLQIAIQTLIPVIGAWSKYAGENISLIDASRAALEALKTRAYDQLTPALVLYNNTQAALIQTFIDLNQATKGFLGTLFSVGATLGPITSIALLLASNVGALSAMFNKLAAVIGVSTAALSAFAIKLAAVTMGISLIISAVVWLYGEWQKQQQEMQRLKDVVAATTAEYASLETALRSLISTASSGTVMFKNYSDVIDILRDRITGLKNEVSTLEQSFY